MFWKRLRITINPDKGMTIKWDSIPVKNRGVDFPVKPNHWKELNKDLKRTWYPETHLREIDL